MVPVTKVWAHRGASGSAPENTLPAFELAIEQGADGLEFDVQLTRDDFVVVIHDETLERTTHGNGTRSTCSARAPSWTCSKRESRLFHRPQKAPIP